MRSGSSPSSLYSCQLVTDMRPQILVAAGVEMDRPNNDGDTPLAHSINYKRADIAEFLLHSGAKMKNVHPHVVLPAWMTDMIAKRCNIMNCALTVKGVLKRRCGLSKDVTHLIALYFWRIGLK
jgi:hypothetical protein